MEFDVNVYREYYDEVHRLGEQLVKYFDGVSPLDLVDFKALQKEISDILQECSNYLDECGMNIPAALWQYRPGDPTTWASDKNFRYRHLLQ